MAYKDLYNILGINKNASDKEIKKAYRKLAAEYHPDKTKGNKVKEEKFKEISEAYQVLGSTEKRRQYDALGADWEQFQQSGRSFDEFMEMKKQFREQSAYQQKRPGGGFSGARDFSDIFDSFFGGGHSGFRREQGPVRGADVSGEIIIDLPEAYHGTKRILNVDGNKIKLNIKPGAYNGLQLRARGKGQKGVRGSSGDLYLEVRVEPHPIFVRKGDDLYMTTSISMFDALLGGQVEVVTLSGKVNISIKEGTQNGKTLRLKGKGMPVYGSPGKYGDLFITLEVKLPSDLTQEQKEMLRTLKHSIKNKV